ncbi:hypothetical protein SETIT_1G033300v2 [Setaria italica]|uniref:Uncharacterized protein n=1 Tax=Setaria italica TaxID=4555 RepID=A0A368PGP7_SETIT|nr:hypothetical protein SETIT_1G033300v2 [Setaria italica]
MGSTRQQYGRMLALLVGQEPGDQRYHTNYTSTPNQSCCRHPRAAACRCCADARSSPCAWPLARAAVPDSPCCPAVVASSPASPPPPALGNERTVWVWGVGVGVCVRVSAWL